MTVYSRNTLLLGDTHVCLLGAEAICAQYLDCGAHFMVWEFRNAPMQLRVLCSCNGGDEDWLVLTRAAPEDMLPTWLMYTDSCLEPDEYHLNGCVIYVGAHA